MKYNPDIHHRCSIRLKRYDYSQAGLYFITICMQNRLCLFGKIEKSNVQLNDAGIMIEHQWQELIYRFDNIKLHEFIVMPNHFHGIVESVGVPLVGTQNDEKFPPADVPFGYPKSGTTPNKTTTTNKETITKRATTNGTTTKRATTRDCPYGWGCGGGT